MSTTTIFGTDSNLAFNHSMLALDMAPPSAVDIFPANRKVRDVITEANDFLVDPLKDLSQKLGEIVGRVLGGIVKGTVDAVANTLMDLVKNLVYEAKQLIAEVTGRVQGLLDHLITELDDVIQKAISAIQRTVVLLKRMIETILQLTHRYVLEAIFQAGIAAYSIMSSVPFSKKTSRLVYASPFSFRPNFNPDGVISIHGNFLMQVDSWFVGQTKVTPIRRTDERVDLRISDLDIPDYGKKEMTLTIKAQRSTGWFGWGQPTEVGQLALFVSQSIDYKILITVTPKITVTREAEHSFRFDHSRPGGGPYAEGPRTFKEIYGPSEGMAKVVRYRREDVKMNGASFKDHLDTLGNIVVAEATLEGRGWFGPGRWARANFILIEASRTCISGEPETHGLDLQENRNLMEATTPNYSGIDKIKNVPGADQSTLIWDVSLRILREYSDGPKISIPLVVEGAKPGVVHVLDETSSISVSHEGSIYIRVNREN